MNTRLAVAVILAISLLAAACGGDGDATSTPTSPAAQPDAAPVVDQFISAANGGDVDRLRALFAEDARFDRAGALFDGRDDIIDRFLEPDVIDPGGRYRETGRRVQNGRLVVSFVFDTGSGGQERFTYAFLIRDGRIQEVVGRYAS
ncbi:nuclear transport factor 2 family protein [Actinomadura sp. SCN-SB]|uniref:nuclear transport factor 2 family protein n=1 Tax=Actinomadura sp. SCN-SB TaxID=3373092 RepID=UPI00375251BF